MPSPKRLKLVLKGSEHLEASSAAALAVLTAMITPAVLISACGALILSTSARLGRVVDRVRTLADHFEELSRSEQELELELELELFEDRRALIFNLLDKLTSRARLLQKSMRVLYLSLGMFVATSVAIGLAAVVGSAWFVWVPVLLGLSGACGLFYGSVLLIYEARVASYSLAVEMDFIWKLGRTLASPELRQTRSPHFNPLTLRRKV